MTWRFPFFDLASGLFIPRPVTWDPETGEFTGVEGPKGFATWQEADEAGRFLRLGLTFGTLCPPLAAEAQQKEKVPRVQCSSTIHLRRNSSPA